MKFDKRQIELITNPSARYDAQGAGGIINIILKKDERLGTNGQINAAIGTRDKYEAGFIFNYGINKLNFFTSYNYQGRRLLRKAKVYDAQNTLPFPESKPYL